MLEFAATNSWPKDELASDYDPRHGLVQELLLRYSSISLLNSARNSWTILKLIWHTCYKTWESWAALLWFHNLVRHTSGMSAKYFFVVLILMSWNLFKSVLFPILSARVRSHSWIQSLMTSAGSSKISLVIWQRPCIVEVVKSNTSGCVQIWENIRPKTHHTQLTDGSSSLCCTLTVLWSKPSWAEEKEKLEKTIEKTVSLKILGRKYIKSYGWKALETGLLLMFLNL